MNTILLSLISIGSVSPQGAPDVATWTIPVIAIGSIIGIGIVVALLIWVALKLLKR